MSACTTSVRDTQALQSLESIQGQVTFYPQNMWLFSKEKKGHPWKEEREYKNNSLLYKLLRKTEAMKELGAFDSDIL